MREKQKKNVIIINFLLFQVLAFNDKKINIFYRFSVFKIEVIKLNERKAKVIMLKNTVSSFLSLSNDVEKKCVCIWYDLRFWRLISIKNCR